MFKKRDLEIGVSSGVLWGGLAVIVNRFTGALPLENPFLYNLIAFTVGGAIFGIVVVIAFSLLSPSLPFKSYLAKGTAVSIGLWLILWLIGMILTRLNPDRYHLFFDQTLQGLILSGILGMIVGFRYQKAGRQ